MSRLAESRKKSVPVGLTEELLMALWSEILGHEEFGVEDNFFELGGNSLLATQIVVRLCAIVGTEIPLGVFFEQPSIRGIHEALSSMLGVSADTFLAKLAEEP